MKRYSSEKTKLYLSINTYTILERYADIRRTLRPLHKDIGDIDTLIAATALEENIMLVTIDHDFERVPDLQVKLVDLKAG
jgi:predicted nucleic acid-binding protein